MKNLIFKFYLIHNKFKYKSLKNEKYIYIYIFQIIDNSEAI
jgi:hypothetical protein